MGAVVVKEADPACGIPTEYVSNTLTVTVDLWFDKHPDKHLFVRHCSSIFRTVSLTEEETHHFQSSV